jgi:hypothetical protein
MQPNSLALVAFMSAGQALIQHLEIESGPNDFRLRAMAPTVTISGQELQIQQGQDDGSDRDLRDARVPSGPAPGDQFPREKVRELEHRRVWFPVGGPAGRPRLNLPT